MRGVFTDLENDDLFSDADVEEFRELLKSADVPDANQLMAALARRAADVEDSIADDK